MKLLHVTATHLKPDGGVPVVLKELSYWQNEIENVSSMVISLVSPVDDMESKYFKYVPSEKFESFIIEFAPDFVILHSFYYLNYNYTVKILLKYNIPYFIEPHGSFGQAAMKKSYFKKKIANNTIFKKQLKNAFGFIFLNDAEKKDSVYHTSHDLIIPNGINVDKEKYKKNDNQVIFYFIGRYDIMHKGLDYMFEALDIWINRDIHLH